VAIASLLPQQPPKARSPPLRILRIVNCRARLPRQTGEPAYHIGRTQSFGAGISASAESIDGDDLDSPAAVRAALDFNVQDKTLVRPITGPGRFPFSATDSYLEI
jgi:hypothetical protein